MELTVIKWVTRINVNYRLGYGLRGYRMAGTPGILNNNGITIQKISKHKIKIIMMIKQYLRSNEDRHCVQHGTEHKGKSSVPSYSS